MSGNVLITGGSGFIGSHLVDAFAEIRKSIVVCYDIGAPKDNRIGNIVTLKGDIFDSDKLVKVMRDREIEDVIHLVALVSIPECRRRPDTSFRLNVSSIHSILEAMRLSGAERLVFPSTAVVYGAVDDVKVSELTELRPTNVYGCHKLAAESIIRGYAEDYGFKTTILRIFNVYGDLEREKGVVSLFVKRALGGKPLIVNGGEQVRDFVHVQDVIEAFLRSLDNRATLDRIINVGSGVGVSIDEIAQLVVQSFPGIEVEHHPLNEKAHSHFADVSRMRTLLSMNPINPKKGIPAFIKECMA
jgi:UDP-glucose 4-epimerase